MNTAQVARHLIAAEADSVSRTLKMLSAVTGTEPALHRPAPLPTRIPVPVAHRSGSAHDADRHACPGPSVAAAAAMAVRASLASRRSGDADRGQHEPDEDAREPPRSEAHASLAAELHGLRTDLRRDRSARAPTWADVLAEHDRSRRLETAAAAVGAEAQAEASALRFDPAPAIDTDRDSGCGMEKEKEVRLVPSAIYERI
jgi:hypothetical protein